MVDSYIAVFGFYLFIFFFYRHLINSYNYDTSNGTIHYNVCNLVFYERLIRFHVR